ncbi:hemagglutinin repeat-containing protein [Rhizobium leguminosarum]|uniref:Filamentous hemagglutinin N-terminal domain-containing protein n=1 Tax=Rhizobium leguminosarum TaxID=384 RepID=A0A7M3DKV3_RHILE|nr:hemagglutinin repeat-containing protein [Rhizobium leguminosarum]MDV4162203.1 hemagglutinin repeat-containing protein [Rhizobium leguminosarum]MDV4172582.1 hemagglutinin repeat-containing protein [Rhizobium leguminosarum]TAY43742.1 filamentous hemagglutinin N-terminal domain-containing protein [Rhizobium leguminosarum]
MREKTGLGSEARGLGCRLGRFGNRSLAIVLSTLLVFQPMLANAQSVSASTTAAAANQPGVGAAPNGVPLIDIVTPNAAGLSHNKYDNFNVGTPGLILNNYKGEIGNSNLGGVTPGNPNLNNSAPASVILNEVTSGNRSALNGPTEVFGGRADVVIANPNGITCDGCGFINTPHATLTTGAPQIGADGKLNGFIVNGGDVTIGPNGGNFAAGPGAVDLFDIVSRAVHVNGPVYGKDLRVTAGAANFDYATGNSQALAPISGTPEYAIDGTALGAMQADRIKIVVTEKGAGVRMSGNLAANTNELSLSADGKISLGNVSGQQGVSISSKAKVTAAKVASKAKVAVQADQGITLDTVAADGDILLSSGSGLLSVGGEANSAANVLMSSNAGIAAGSVVAGNALTLSSTSGDIQVGGAAKGGGALTITATSGSIAAASLVSGNDITLAAGADIGVSGDMLAQGNVTASGRSISADTVVSGLDIAATNAAANGSTVLSGAGDIQLTASSGAVDVDALLSAGDTSVTSAALIAQSVIAHGAIAINAATDVSGQILSGGNIDLTGSAIATDAIIAGIDFAGTEAAGGNIVLTQSGDLSLAASGDIDTGTLLAAGNISASAANLSAAAVTSHGAITLSGNTEITGQLLGAGDVSISGGSIAADTIVAGMDFAATAASPGGAIAAGTAGDLTLDAGSSGSVDIDTLLAAGSLLIDAGRFQADNVSGHGAVTITADTSVTGQLLGAGDVSVTGPAIQAGAIVSGVDFAATAQSANGDIALGQTGALTLKATATDISAGNLLAAGNVDASAAGDVSANVVAHQDMTIVAGGTIDLTGQSLAAGNASLSARDITVDTLVSGLDFAATAASAGTLKLQQTGSMSLAATSGSITAGNALLSSGALSASASQNIAYNKLQSLSSAALTASGGQISYGNPTRTAGNLTLTTTNIDLSNGRASNIATGGTLTLNAASANLANSSLTLGGLALDLSGTADLSGARVNAITTAGGSGDIAIKATGLTTTAGTALLAANDLTLTLPSLTNTGQLAARNHLTFNIAGNFTNSATGLAYAGNDASLFVGGVLTNNQGAILANHDLQIAGVAAGLRNTEVTNISGLIQAGNDMSILTSALTNQRAATPQWTTGTLVSSGVVSGFTLNPVAAGLPFGYLETADQNMYQLYAGVDPGLWQDYQPLLWSKATLADGTTYRAWTWISADGPEKVGPIIDWIRDRVPRDANGNPVVDPNNPSRYFIVDEVNFSGSDESTTYTWDWSSHLSQSVYEDRLVGTLSPEATIRASRNLSIDATNLTNAYSSIEAGGNATLKGSTLTNTGVSLFRTTTTTCQAQGACTAYDANGNANPSKNIANGTTIVSSVQAIGGVSANIKAGGALSVNFGSVNNTSAAGSVAGGASLAASSNPGDPLSALTGLTAGGALFNVNSALGGVTANGRSLLTGLGNIADRIRVDGKALEAAAKPQSGGVDGNIPHQIFLFETRGDFLDVSKFYGSGYFMREIGYVPETTVPFLGDAYFENQLIDTQLRQLVGEGLGRSTFIAGNSAIEQMKTLLDNGVTYAQDNGLAVGQGLTPEQAAALTKSIVLYQWQTVDGVQVLAPVVYVAAADRQKLSGAGAVMAGGSVDMNVGNLDNSGLIASAGGLTVSGSSIQGSGTFLSRGDTTLNATNGITLAAQTMTIGGQNLVNANAGVTAGGNLLLAGGSGDLALKGVKVNATRNASLTGNNVTLAAAKVDNAGQQNATASQVASGVSLTIKATDNVNVIGSSAKAGTTLDVTADKGSVAVVSTDVARNNQSGYTKTLSTDQQQSQLSAGTNATIKSGDDILLSGSSVKAGGNVALNAGDDINITAAQETSASSFGKKSASSITNVGSEISAGGDLSVAAGSGSGDHDLNIVGSKLAADGKVVLKAAGDVTIAEATDTATLDTKLSVKGGFLGKSEKTTTHLETTTAVGSAITGGGGVDIASGKDTVISASKIEAGKETGAADLNITAGGDLVIASGKDTSAKDDKGSRSGFLSKGSSSYKSYDETTVASELGASGNISLSAGGAAVIAGSKADADGSISVEGDSVSVIGAAEQHQLEITRKESGLFVGSGDGFISLWGKEQKTGNQASALNVASVLSAGTDITIKSWETDVNIIGSSLGAGQNLTLDAARDVNITPGAETASAEEKEKRSGFGIAFSSGNGGASIGIGYGKSVDQTAQSSATNAVSTLSAGRDLTISAGRDANLQATQVEAGRNAAILADRNVNLLSAQDVSNYTTMHEELFAGVSLTVSSKLASAADNLVDAAGKLGGPNSVYALAPAALAAYRVNDVLNQIDSGGQPLASATLSVGFTYEKNSATTSASIPVVTTIKAGDSVNVAARSGDLTGRGVQIAAGSAADPATGNVLLMAGGSIQLESAQATSSSRSSSQSANGSIGVDLASGGLTGGGGIGNSKQTANSVAQVNSHVTGTGNVTLASGGDTTLAGAVVSGERVTAAVGGDLNIISRQDTIAYDEKAAGGGLNLSPSGKFSGGYQKSTVEGDYANVSEQSGIVAGSGGYHITAGGNVDLVGGVIGSTADPANNALSASSLTWSDIGNRSEASASSLGISLTPSGLPVPVVGQPAKEEDHGVARATLTAGQLTLTNQTQDLAALNTDLSKANNSVEPFDIQRLKAKQESAAALSALANIAVGDLSAKLGFAEGSPEKIALHAAVGALVAQLAGGNAGTGALAGGLSEVANGVLQQVLKANPDLTDEQKSVITQWVAAIVGFAVGGTTGAATALDNVDYNFLTHKQRDDLAKELKDCASATDPASCKAAVSDKYSDLDFDQEHQLDACRTRQCVQDLLGDLNGDPRFAYLDVVELQELGVSEALAQRLLSYQVLERWLTGDATVFELKLMDVAAGVGYCEDTGQSDGCFAMGQALHYVSSTVVELAYVAMGLRAGEVKGGAGEEVASGCSFDGSTLVKTIDGFTAISQIRPGETSVWSRDEQGHAGYKPVLRRFLDRHPETVYLDLEAGNGKSRQTITTTLLHRVFAVLPEGASKSAQIAIDGRFYSGPIGNGVWIAIKDLKPGDRMLDDDGSWSRVVSVRVEAKPLDAYNLTVADFHTYFVKQAANDDAKPVWVHNVTCQVLGEPVVFVPNSSSTKVFNRIQLTSFGETVYDGALDLRPIMNEIRANAGSNGAHDYMNVDGLLPGPRGSANNYTTYTIEVPGVESSPARLLYSTDGSIWFTPNHYGSFVRIK